MATWDRYKERITSFEVQSQKGAIFTIRSFCDDPSGGVYVAKAPVCNLKLTPTVQFVNTNIAWDATQSDSATGTVDTFDIDWGGTTDIGDLVAQDWATDPKTGNVQYTTVGTYTVTMYVTDTLGEESKRCKQQVRIISYVGLNRLFIGTSSTGVYLVTPLAGPTKVNTGLTGAFLTLRSMRMNPWYKDLDNDNQHIWVCSAGGMSYSTDGSDNWTSITEATLGTPANDAGDGTPPTATDPDNIDFAFDPQDPDRIYLLRTTTTPNDRTWVYYTDDYGATWSNVQVIA